MSKTVQGIIIGLLALNAIGVFMLITKIDDTRVGIVKRMTDNKNDIIAEIVKTEDLLYDIKGYTELIQHIDIALNKDW